jgi:hypothetical protein
MGTGVVVLAAGILFYLIARSPEQVYFLPNGLDLNTEWSRHPGAWTGSLPSFVHALAFTLMTTSVLGCMRFRCTLAVGISWLFIDFFFEFAQHPVPGTWLAAHTPDWFSYFPVLENTRPYFMSGTFDLLDLVGTFLGVALAVVIVTLVFHKEERR